MVEIESKFEPGKSIWQTEMKKITIKMLKTYCDLFDININKHFLKKSKTIKKYGKRIIHIKKYSVPGAMILDMFRPTIEKLSKEDASFPISMINNMEFGCGTTSENPIFTNDDLIFKVQQIFYDNKKSHEKKFGGKVEIYRDDHIVFKGTFDFIQKK